MRQPSDPSAQPPNFAAALRAAADSESIPGMTASLAGDAPSRIRFEQDLRASMGRVMQSPAMPAAARDRILAVLRAEPMMRGALSETSNLKSDLPSDASRADAHRRRSRTRRAIGATLLLIALAATIFMRSGFMRSGPTTNPSAPVAAGVFSSDLISSIFSFANQQHSRYSLFADDFNQDMTVRDPIAARDFALIELRRVPSALGPRAERILGSGYTFAGVGQSALPGKGRSAHLIFKPDPASNPDAPPISLFVQEDDATMPFLPDCAYTSAGCKMNVPESGCTLTMWREDGLMYFLVAPDSISAPARSAFISATTQRPWCQ